jgi:hypothetical protein
MKQLLDEDAVGCVLVPALVVVALILFDRNKARDWVETEGKIITVNAITRFTTAESEGMPCKFSSYEYFIAGKRFLNSQSNIYRTEMICRSDPTKIDTSSFPQAGESIKIWYDRNEPSFSVRDIAP